MTVKSDSEKELTIPPVIVVVQYMNHYIKHSRARVAFCFKIYLQATTAAECEISSSYSEQILHLTIEKK